MLMKRSVTVSVDLANDGKKLKLDSIFLESRRVVNLFIDKLWKLRDFSSKFIGFKVDTWLSARMNQCLGKQALQIVKSQRKKKKKHKPRFEKDVIELDERFVDVQFDDNTFDIWVKIASIENRMSINLPARKHKHLNRYFNDGWTLKKSMRLRKFEGRYFIDLYFEKEQAELATTGASIGCDIGYKKLIALSDGRTTDIDFTKVYEKIVRKKQASKQFKKTLKERDNLINREINKLDLSMLKTLVVEDLKNVKHKSRFSKQFNNKLSRWSYPRVLDKLNRVCEERGIKFIKVNPAYTSQTCNVCDFIHKDNRHGVLFKCLKCGMTMDADLNAAINILHRGVYSPPVRAVEEDNLVF